MRPRSSRPPVCVFVLLVSQPAPHAPRITSGARYCRVLITAEWWSCSYVAPPKSMILTSVRDGRLYEADEVGSCKDREESAASKAMGGATDTARGGRRGAGREGPQAEVVVSGGAAKRTKGHQNGSGRLP